MLKIDEKYIAGTLAGANRYNDERTLDQNINDLKKLYDRFEATNNNQNFSFNVPLNAQEEMKAVVNAIAKKLGKLK